MTMDLEKIEATIQEVIAKAKTEIDNLTDEQKMQLAGGYDNRGLDCISERWYGPDELRSNSALATLGSIVLAIEDMLRDFHSTVEWDEGY